MRRLIIGMTGSTGAIFGVRMLEALKGSEVETHLIISKWAQRTLEHETRYTVEQVRSLASVVHSQGDMGAAISSGSFKTDLVRLVQDRRHGGDAVLGAHARRHR